LHRSAVDSPDDLRFSCWHRCEQQNVVRGAKRAVELRQPHGRWLARRRWGEATRDEWQAELDSQLATELAAIPDGTAKQDGIQVGQSVAKQLLAIRAGDANRRWPIARCPGRGRARSRKARDGFYAMTNTLKRPASADRVRQLLLRVLESASFPGSEDLRAQIPFVEVTGGPITLLDLAVGAGPKSAARNGPIPIRAIVTSYTGEPAGELLLWVKDGYLSGLEFAWVTDQQPESLPSIDHVQIEGSGA
jgi:hypothetical protein